MKDAITDLLGSKRFIVIVLTIVPLTVLSALGRLPIADLVRYTSILGGVLATLYGAENVSMAHGMGFPEPAPTVTTTQTQVQQSPKKEETT